MINGKKTIFSAIQPTGMLTLGHYFGAISNWVALQDEYNCCYSVADLHSLTVKNDPKDLRKNSIEMMASLIACGVDPEKCLLFFQSHVPTHAQLSWILNCYTMLGELKRMTQFKDKSSRHPENINAGLFDYPVLMAADILLYQADLVPVGEDQKQHLELTRNIAIRFNNTYSDTFTVPEPLIPKVGARIMSLADPTKKMSKSDPNVNSFVAILDDKDTVIRKFRRAVTDSDTVVRYAEDKAGINNLMTIYSGFTGRSFAEIESEFEGKGYGDFKTAVGETVADALAPIREKYSTLISDKAQLEAIYKSGAEQATAYTTRTLRKVMKKVGLIEK